MLVHAFLVLAAVSFSSQAPADPGGVVGRVAQEKGRVVVLNFWAAWCEPCKREMPMLARLSNEYASRGVTSIGASIDDAEEVEAARAFARQKRIPYPLIFGATTKEMIAYGLGDAVPVTVVLDREGVPRFRMVGELKEKDLRARIDWLLAAGGATGSPAELIVPGGMTVEHFKEDHEQGESEEHKLKEQEEAKEGGSAVPG